MSNPAAEVEEVTDTDDADDRHDDHLRDLEDGSGCTEIWEHLSERREAAEE
ncbi:hypothetical protein SAMN04487949_3177 [Halogranum gelatinilyticum]|jgi:hypothetical protein|uniref:Uncharacterized protein n=1 Tax=Halogranum gelatinilyticum TaxID=660521 RepID=A0A1G9XY35_9EURY|nr:hypothetical protein [Halogranum gelatinilyticum]SDN01654.1 hypothetical protein SAMN04487949_3177 [Halogranum gelatinilyticum]